MTLTHHLNYTINILLYLLYIYLPLHSIYPSVHLISDAFESKLQILAHCPLSTSGWQIIA